MSLVRFSGIRHFSKYRGLPKAVREQVWIKNLGKNFESKCYISWCENKINVFNFQVGHDIPRSKGGGDNLKNLKPICPNCNMAMGNRYTIKQWDKLYK